MDNVIFVPRKFLSTLSLRRATADTLTDDVSTGGFLSTLSLRRATNARPDTRLLCAISIHALLAESDPKGSDNAEKLQVFLSTLSLRRAT